MWFLAKILVVITSLSAYLIFSVSCVSESTNKPPVTTNKISNPKTTNTNPTGALPVNTNHIAFPLNKTNTSTSVLVPFNPSQWHSLQYRSIPPNTVQFSKDHILIKVKNSASPLIYPMTNNPLSLTGIAIEGQIDRLIHITTPDQQGKDGLDDFILRMGLVLIGHNRLNWLKRQIAPKWIIKMHDLAPANQGIDHIYFLSAVQSSNLLNVQRTHPLSQYIKEHYVWLMNKPGDFSYSYRFQIPKQTVALWISSDGDDTQSEFNLTIKKISLFFNQ